MGLAVFAPAPSLQGPTAIRNVYNWRVKETERMVAIVTELTKLGAKVGGRSCVLATTRHGRLGPCRLRDNWRAGRAGSQRRLGAFPEPFRIPQQRLPAARLVSQPAPLSNRACCPPRWRRAATTA